MGTDLAGSVAVVTGAGSGIGRATSHAFARRGCRVVMTNIVEQITFYGEPQPPRSPNFGVIDADTAGELIADGVAAGRFLILTAPEVADELAERGRDVDAYLDRAVRDYT